METYEFEYFDNYERKAKVDVFKDSNEYLWIDRKFKEGEAYQDYCRWYLVLYSIMSYFFLVLILIQFLVSSENQPAEYYCSECLIFPICPRTSKAKRILLNDDLIFSKSFYKKIYRDFKSFWDMNLSDFIFIFSCLITTIIVYCVVKIFNNLF